jgi:signal transduction histidine kinase
MTVATRNPRVAGDAEPAPEFDVYRHENLEGQALMLPENFLASVAHELRGPLSAINLACERIALGCDVEQQQHLSGLVLRQVRYMSSMVDELLDVARTKRRGIALQLQSCRLGHVIDAALELAQPLIEGREQLLVVSPESRRVDLIADPMRLCQIISNLLINAAKYTPPAGRIDLQACVDERDVVIRVSDNGKGLSLADRRRLFRPFAQVHDGVSPRGGVGLGLAFSKMLVCLHKGSLRAISHGPGRGSCFEVRLPSRCPIEADSRNTVDQAREAAPGEQDWRWESRSFQRRSELWRAKVSDLKAFSREEALLWNAQGVQEEGCDREEYGKV